MQIYNLVCVEAYTTRHDLQPLFRDKANDNGNNQRSVNRSQQLLSQYAT